MKEALICLIVALLFGALFNSTRQLDFWGTSDDKHNAAYDVPLVSDGDFEDEVLKAKSPVLVDFYRNDSQTSKDMTPTFAEVARKLKGKVKVVRVETAESAQSAQAVGINAVPDFVIMYRGGIVDHMVGKISSQDLMSFVDRNLDRLGTESEQPKQPKLEDLNVQPLDKPGSEWPKEQIKPEGPSVQPQNKPDSENWNPPSPVPGKRATES